MRRVPCVPRFCKMMERKQTAGDNTDPMDITAYAWIGRTARLAGAGVCLCALIMSGCATQPRGMHAIPLVRDYQDLARTTLDDAEQAVQAARRAGAAGFAPHAYGAAENYLALAWEAQGRKDIEGVWDYATLAVRYANEATDAAPPTASPASDDRPPNEEATWRAVDELAATWKAIDPERAAYALPFLYADLTAAVSRIEQALHRGDWEVAARWIPEAEIMARTLRARDMDGDGIPDMTDEDPWQPEAPPEPPPAPLAWRSIPFGSGSVLIDAESMGYLRGVADYLRQAPGWQLHVSGHTDSRHSESYSLDLSRRRAEAVSRFLVGVGAPADRVTVSYYGSARPLEPSVPGMANAVNRRVELRVEYLPESAR